MDAQFWLTIAGFVVVLLPASVTGLWVYTSLVVERGLLPPAQLDVECRTVGRHADQTLIEAALLLSNSGGSTLIARDIRLDVRYIGSDDELEHFNAPSSRGFGRTVFPRSLRADLSNERLPGRGFLLISYDTFVQSKVTQRYAFVTHVPAAARYLLLWGSFHYAQRPHRLQHVAVRASRGLGLVQFDLSHVREPHTVERVFVLEDASS